MRWNSLHNVLLLDALVSGATGIALLATASWLAGWLGLPETLLRAAGVTLLPFAAGLLALARRAPIPVAGVRGVIALNVLWIAASFGLLLVDAITPTGLGVAFVIAQAGAVAVFSELEVMALRRSGAAHAPAR